MVQRVSTSAQHAAAVARILTAQSRLGTIQAQLASGKRVQTPADDPVAAVRINDLERGLAQLTQYATNASIATGRLNLEEQALADAGNLLNQARELALQANSPALDATSRNALATELATRIKDLQDIANRRDASGEYLFAGYSTRTQPFNAGGSGVVYAGDQGSRSVQIGPDQRVVQGHSGQDVFMDVPQGNGTFLTATGVRAGAASIDSGQLIDASAYVRDTYTVHFIDPVTYEVLDSGNNQVTTGAYVPGQVIAFRGVQVTVSGEPAVDDTFTLTPAGKESIFTTLQQLVGTLQLTAGNSSARAELNTQVGAALTQLDQGLEHLLSKRTEVGSRLIAVDSAEDSRSQYELELTTQLGGLRDIDYAEAIGRMNVEMVGLQAAQSAYARIAQLSLFNYL